MAVVTPLNNFLGPEGDTVTVDEQLLNTEYWDSDRRVTVNNIQVMLVCGSPGDRGGGTETPAASVPVF